MKMLLKNYVEINNDTISPKVLFQMFKTKNDSIFDLKKSYLYFFKNRGMSYICFFFIIMYLFLKFFNSVLTYFQRNDKP